MLYYIFLFKKTTFKKTKLTYKFASLKRDLELIQKSEY